MTTIRPGTAPTNPAAITSLLATLLAGEPSGEQPPALTYLRRKAGRGMVAVYGNARDPRRLYTVTVAEDALGLQPGEQTPVPEPRWQGHWPGLVAEPTLGLAVQAFPSDRTLPALTAAMTPTTRPQLWEELAAAGAARLPAGAAWTLCGARAYPVRYKPGDRVVIRYQLGFRRPGAEDAAHARVSVIGKLYRDPAQATAAWTLLERLRQSPCRNWCPAPLARVDSLGLVITEDLGDGRGDPPTRPGTDVIQPGEPLASAIIAAAARALVDLHTSDTDTPATPLRSGTDEAGKAAKRAQVLATYLPSLAPEIDRISRRLCDRLRSLEPAGYRPSHGSYKPSQLLVRNTSAFVVDFDQFCRADPALDVGYFAAYLRPPGMFYHRPGTRGWFESAAAAFRQAYVAQARQRDVSAEATASIVARSAIYEAALLLKIAARRPNRLQSPRPGEVQAILDDITGCLAAAESA
jgi:hypothetical protein